MKEIITLQVGQCGNQIGWKFWDKIHKEHGVNQDSFLPALDDATSSFFQETLDNGRGVLSLGPDSSGSSIKVKARAILVDTEEGVVSQLVRSPLRNFFHKDYIVTDISGAGNNWAHGYCEYGPSNGPVVIEAVRKALEACESPQAFLMMHSTGGGTGSGLGSWLLEALRDSFPEPYRLSVSLLPSENDDVITSPYNALLSTSRLVSAADCVFPIENQALIDIITTYEGENAVADGGFASYNTRGRSLSNGANNYDIDEEGQLSEPELSNVDKSSILDVIADADALLESIGKCSSTADAQGPRKSNIPKANVAARIMDSTSVNNNRKLLTGNRPIVRVQPRTLSAVPKAGAIQASRSSSGTAAANVSTRAVVTQAQCSSNVHSKAALQRKSSTDQAIPTQLVRAVTGKKSGTAFDSMNALVGRMLSELTASMRFSGSLNLDLNELATTLVPFPKMHFLSTSMTPLQPSVHRSSPTGISHTPNTVTGVVADSMHRQCSLVRGQIRGSTTLACGVFFRGSAQLSDVVTSVKRLQSDLNMTPWNRDGFKVSMCSNPSPFAYNGAPCSCLLVLNNTHMSSCLKSMYDKFLRLYSVGAHLHHYLDFLEAKEIQDAAISVYDVIDLYKEYHTPFFR